jgi:MFS transporter, DHA2 family, multidrug resistance protein
MGAPSGPAPTVSTRGTEAPTAPNKWLVTAAISLGTLMGTIDISIVNVALPHVQASFGVAITEAAWITTAYLVAIVMILPLTGWLGASFGRKRVYQTGLIVFTAASFLAGVAPSLTALIAARALQGLGAGVLGPMEQSILRETFPSKQQGLATGLYGMILLVGPTIGPVLGGTITDSYTWRWIFFINLPVGVLASAMVALIIREAPRTGVPRLRFDFVGVAFMAAGLSSLVVVMEQGNRWDWFDSPLVWGLTLTAVSSLLLFVFWELFGTDAPAVDLRILGERAFSAAWVSVGIVAFGLFSGLILMSLFLQQNLGYTATQAGIQFFPRGLVSMVVSPIGGIIAGLLGPRFVVAPGLFLAGVALFMMSHWTLNAGPREILVPMVVLGVAFPMMIIPLFASALSSVDRSKAIGAAGLMNLMLQLGGSFGTAITTTMLERGIDQFHARLVEQARPDHPAWAEAARQVTALMTTRGGSDPIASQQQALVLLDRIITGQAAVLSFEHAFQVIALAYFGALLAMPFLPGKSRPEAGAAGAVDV